jgi:hypothetical protein
VLARLGASKAVLCSSELLFYRNRSRFAEARGKRGSNGFGFGSSCCVRGNTWGVVAFGMGLSPVANGFLVDFGKANWLKEGVVSY